MASSNHHSTNTAAPLVPKQEGNLKPSVKQEPIDPALYKPGSFRFINLSATQPKHDRSTKKIVRSHVMQRYRNEQRSAGAVFLQQQYTVFYQTYAEGREEPCCFVSSQEKEDGFHVGMTYGSTVVCQRHGGIVASSRYQEMASVVESMEHGFPGSASVDPFSCLPMQLSTRNARLLEHYKQIVLGLCLPAMDPQIQWLRYALADEALIHCLLLYAAQHSEIMTGSSRRADVYLHKGEVMRVVNERIGSEKERVSDATIDAITCLIRFEEMFGHTSIAEAHRAGLNQIVAIRGGMGQLDNPVREVVAHSQLKPSPIPMWKMLLDRSRPPSRLMSSIQKLDVSMYANSNHDTRFDQLDPDMIEIFCRLRNSSMLMSATMSRGDVSHDLEMSEQYLLRARVDELLQGSTESGQKPIAWLIASILYATTVLSTSLTDEVRVEVVDELTARLQYSMAAEHLPIHHRIYASNVMLWMLLVGALYAESASKSDWFRHAIAELSRTIHLQRWSDVRYRLRDYPWSQTIELPGNMLWNACLSGASRVELHYS